MKFNFKIQQYQTDAVDAVVKVFQGQGYHDKSAISETWAKTGKSADAVECGYGSAIFS